VSANKMTSVHAKFFSCVYIGLSVFSATYVCVCMCVCVCVRVRVRVCACVDIPTHSSAHGVHVQPKQSRC
jgi:hypothetical protein